jgi:glutamine synthetase
LHVSLLDLQGLPLSDAGTSNGLSTLGQHWAAGILHYLPALCAFTAPTPVSYERLQPHHWSASYACLGQQNREAALRICPTVSLGGKSVAAQFNLEFRAMDATASPHLAMAALLIAGRLGIEQRLRRTRSPMKFPIHSTTSNARPGASLPCPPRWPRRWIACVTVQPSTNGCPSRCSTLTTPLKPRNWR